MYGDSKQARPSDPVTRVMTWPVATVETQTTLDLVAQKLAEDEVGAVLVLSEHGLAGLISERDVVAHVAEGSDLSRLSAGDVMSSDLITVQGDASVLDAARAMNEALVRHVPVLDGSDVVGVVSIRDVCAVLAETAGE